MRGHIDLATRLPLLEIDGRKERVAWRLKFYLRQIHPIGDGQRLAVDLGPAADHDLVRLVGLGDFLGMIKRPLQRRMHNHAKGLVPFLSRDNDVGPSGKRPADALGAAQPLESGQVRLGRIEQARARRQPVEDRGQIGDAVGDTGQMRPRARPRPVGGASGKPGTRPMWQS